MGRPFKGVVDEMSKEPDVPERRSLLRGFKKFYSSIASDKRNNANSKSKDLI